MPGTRVSGRLDHDVVQSDVEHLPAYRSDHLTPPACAVPITVDT
jgi:hypothetical protein